MGTPVKEPYYGDDCTNGIPTLWKSGKTPRVVSVTFTGILKCWGTTEDPPNGSYYLIQASDEPCRWQYENNAGLLIIWSLGADTSHLELSNTILHNVYFTQTYLIGCQVIFSNELVCPANRYGEGIGSVSWTPNPIVTAVAVDYSFAPLDGTLYDITECGIDHEIIKLANSRDKTNVLIYVDKEDFL